MFKKVIYNVRTKETRVVDKIPPPPLKEQEFYKRARYILTELKGAIIEDKDCKELGHWGEKGYMLIVSGDFFNTIRANFKDKEDYKKALDKLKKWEVGKAYPL